MLTVKYKLKPIKILKNNRKVFNLLEEKAILSQLKK